MENNEKNSENRYSVGELTLDDINGYLIRIYPSMRESGYQLTDDNILQSDFLLQTPEVWSLNADQVPIDKGIDVPQSIEKIIALAENFVDITTLGPFPDGKFFDAIKNALIRLAKKNKKIIIRILAGWANVDLQDAQKNYLAQLISEIGFDNQLEIYVGVQRDLEEGLTWNHSKIVAVDGKYALTGGENLWDANYLGPYPVHDLNIKIEGSSAYYMHQFIDRIWYEVSTYRSEWASWFWSKNTRLINGCLWDSKIPHVSSGGNIKVLGAGRYGTTNASLKPSDGAILYCLQAAKESICITQQDIINYLIPWPEGMDALADAVIRGVQVKIVISNDEGKASNTRNPQSTDGAVYSTSTQVHTYEELKLYIEERAFRNRKSISGSFQIAVLRFGPSDQWPEPVHWQFANHAKFFMVDEKIFAIGSENIYPANLIEYLVFIEDENALDTVKNKYWEMVWKYSERTAINFR